MIFALEPALTYNPHFLISRVFLLEKGCFLCKRVFYVKKCVLSYEKNKYFYVKTRVFSEKNDFFLCEKKYFFVKIRSSFFTTRSQLEPALGYSPHLKLSENLRVESASLRYTSRVGLIS